MQLNIIKITEEQKNEFFRVLGLGLLFGMWVTKFGVDEAWGFFFLVFAVKVSKFIANKLTNPTVRWLNKFFKKVGSLNESKPI